MAPEITQDELAYLDMFVTEHFEAFIQLYPDQVVTPKMHYIVHMPCLIIKLFCV